MSNLDKLEKIVLRWWKIHRPIGFSLRQHIENPTINGAYKPLARLAAKIAKDKL